MNPQNSPASYFEDRSHPFLSCSPDNRLIVPRLPQRRRIPRRLFWFTSLGLLVLVLNLWGTIFSPPQTYAAVRPPVVLKGDPSKPNRMSPTAGSDTSPSPYHPAPEGSAPIGKPQAILHRAPLSMKAGSLALLPSKATRFLGSDGHLEVNIPATAISAQDQQQAGGALHVQVSQIAPPSGSNAGGSGHLSLGTYLLQLVDAKGVLVNHGLHAPITVTYHYNKQEAALNLDHAYLVQNGTRPPQGIPTAAMKTNVALANTFGTPSSQAVQLNTAQSTLQATPTISTPSTSLTWQSDVSIYYDDTPNKYCDASTGTATPYPCPILWHTATETHTKIYAYVGPNSLPQMSAKPPCFRVWRPNGVMEEFGCTPDSLQHYYQASVGAHLVSSWLLDLNCVYCGNPSEVADHEPSLQQRWINGEYDHITEAQARADADNPARMVGACISCNSSKGGRPLEGENNGWGWETSPAYLRRIEGL